MPGLAPLGTKDPTTVGPYRLLGVLGNGGMGRVYLGQSPAGRRLAIKVIHSELAEDPTFRARFAREVAAARSVSPLFTAAVIDSDATAAEPWLATTYIDGISLERKILDDGPMPAAEAAALAAGLAEALSSIHAVGLVHRDLKPGNVLIDETGPHIIDFGLALGTADLRVTTSLVVGTPSYMAPERLRGEDAGPPSDIFSFGATLVFATTGHDLVDDTNVYQQVIQISEGRYNLLGVPAGLRSLIVRCVSYEPRDRPTAPELTRILVAFAAGDSSAMAEVGPEIVPDVSIMRQRTPPRSPVDGHTPGRRMHDTPSGATTAELGVAAAGATRLPHVSRRVLLGTAGAVGAVAVAGTLIAAANSVLSGDNGAGGLPTFGSGPSGSPSTSDSSSVQPPPSSPTPSATPTGPVRAGDVLWAAGTPAQTMTTATASTGTASQTWLVTPQGLILTIQPSGVVATDSSGRTRWTRPLSANLTGMWAWGDSFVVTDGIQLWFLDGTGKIAHTASPVGITASQLPAAHGPVTIGGSAAFTADVAYITVGDAIVALDRSGRQVWAHPQPAANVPLAVDGRWLVAHAVSRNSITVGLYDAATGKAKWSQSFHGGGLLGFLAQLTGDGNWSLVEARLTTDHVIVRAASDIQVLNIATGSIAWHAPSSKATTAIELAGSRLLIAADQIYAYDLTFGGIIWRSKINGARLAVATTPSVIVAATPSAVAGLDLTSGKAMWHAQMPASASGGNLNGLTVGPHVAFVAVRRNGGGQGNTPPSAGPSFIPPPGGLSFTPPPGGQLYPAPGADAPETTGPVEVVAVALDSSAHR